MSGLYHIHITLTFNISADDMLLIEKLNLKNDFDLRTASLGVKEEYLNAAFDQMKTKYGTIENYFSEALGINEARQTALRNLFLNK